MNLCLENKHVIVTGGTKGIGLSIAMSFLAEGSIVSILSRSSQVELERSIASQFSGRVNFYQCDVSDEAQLSIVSKKIEIVTNGVVDIVIANVGSGRSVSDPISESGVWNRVWDINFRSALNTASVFSNILIKNKGSLVFISSIAGLEFIGAPTDYSVAKSALISFSKTLSHRLAPAVRVNVIAPGNIFIEDGTWCNKMNEDQEKVQSMLMTKVPLQRFGLPEEVSDLVLFLSSSKASFITGSCFVIDGGQTTGF